MSRIFRGSIMFDYEITDEQTMVEELGMNPSETELIEYFTDQMLSDIVKTDVRPYIRMEAIY